MSSTGIPAPLSLLAELTHGCPLHCAYCSNPLELAARDTELPTATWARVFAEAAALGVAQIHLSGGEPLLRRDLAALVGACAGDGLYTNLITSGVGLTGPRVAELAAAGLDHVQLSVQDADRESADRIAGARVWPVKIAAARAVAAAGLPLTVNVVLHRQNLDRLEATVALAEELGAQRLELAHTQYYGWAVRNRDWLLPTAAQVERAAEVAAAAAERLAGRTAVVYVQPDLHTGQVKPCLGGWGRVHLAVAPDGDVLPCQVAGQIPDLVAENVTRRPLSWIWYSSPAFARFRGTAWMAEPCRSCEFREIDHGGCRCQAYQLTGDPNATDPACHLSPHRATVDALLTGAAAAPQQDPEPRPSAPHGRPLAVVPVPRKDLQDPR
ncbi:MAG: pyrroloquinoline quinone biosynthesis protein PqqE [Mycobacteriales bacterium]